MPELKNQEKENMIVVVTSRLEEVGSGSAFTIIKKLSYKNRKLLKKQVQKAPS